MSSGAPSNLPAMTPSAAPVQAQVPAPSPLLLVLLGLLPLCPTRARNALRLESAGSVAVVATQKKNCPRRRKDTRPGKAPTSAASVAGVGARANQSRALAPIHAVRGFIPRFANVSGPIVINFGSGPVGPVGPTTVGASVDSLPIQEWAGRVAGFGQLCQSQSWGRDVEHVGHLTLPLSPPSVDSLPTMGTKPPAFALARGYTGNDNDSDKDMELAPPIANTANEVLASPIPPIHTLPPVAPWFLSDTSYFPGRISP
ncbi:hypothetical protein N7478_013052 [Penicillium angulare]|uniref:uncharacterized protein n=1 Tax=Penicillium angulare TaxID=116970 RepID=UPI002541E50B|nr:uncharacterized protein N7478_013052 [Penicillium angulare]KAJ5256948.1 hypothetical protein N7478_013052 [Penicillium angulare]